MVFAEWVACVDVNTNFYKLSGESADNIALAVMGKCGQKREAFTRASEQSMLEGTSKNNSVRRYARQQAEGLTEEFSNKIRERIFQNVIEDKAISELKK